jgi:hypothetical protein
MAPSASEVRGCGRAARYLNFAALLRQQRTQARLAPEELAEATSLSPRSISDLEHLRRDKTVITTRLTHPQSTMIPAPEQGRWLEWALA